MIRTRPSPFTRRRTSTPKGSWTAATTGQLPGGTSLHSLGSDLADGRERGKAAGTATAACELLLRRGAPAARAAAQAPVADN
jgi:hypothetical protein